MCYFLFSWMKPVISESNEGSKSMKMDFGRLNYAAARHVISGRTSIEYDGKVVEEITEKIGKLRILYNSLENTFSLIKKRYVKRPNSCETSTSIRKPVIDFNKSKQK